jgi:hypothetical protein
MANKYYYLVASLPSLRLGRKSRITKEAFLYECEKWLTPGDMKYLLSADYSDGMPPRTENELLNDLRKMDYGLREDLAEIRKAQMRDEPPRVPEWLRPVMDAEDPLKAEMALARIRWDILEERSIENFFDINWLVLYFLKVQMLKRLNTFDKEKGEPFGE